MEQIGPETSARLRAAGVTRSVASGSAVFREGDPANAAFIVTEGLFKVTQWAGQGRVVLLGLRGPGSIVGEQGVIDAQPRSATMVALQDSQVLSVAKAEFLEIIATRGDLAIAMLEQLSRRLRETSRHLADRAAADPEARVAARILELIDDETLGQIATSNGRPIAVPLPISQQELADWAGLSREGVVKVLRAFRVAGWIETARKRIVIHDFDALRGRATGA